MYEKRSCKNFRLREIPENFECFADSDANKKYHQFEPYYYDIK